MNAADVGAVLFGVVVGWVTYRSLARRTGDVGLSDIATVIGAVGGAAVLGIFHSNHLFGLYAIGLAAGFFAYLALFFAVNGRAAAGRIMGDSDKPLRFE